MADYTVIADRVWMPFVMSTTLPHIDTPALKTDGLGFRYTIGAGGERFSPEDGCDGPVNLLVGASQPFGFGVTADDRTIASRLAQSQGAVWYNFSAPAHTLTQNIVHLLFHLPRLPKVDRIVVLGGVTDMNHFCRTPLYPKGYGSFFQFIEFFRKMNADYVADDGAELRIPGELRHWFRENSDPLHDYRDFLDVVENAVSILKLLSTAVGAHLTFALQPVIRWMDRPPSAEEERLIGAKDDRALALDRLTATAYRDWYGAALAGICRKADVDYLDLNLSFGQPEHAHSWLFADNVHLNDAGSCVAAACLDRM